MTKVRKLRLLVNFLMLAAAIVYWYSVRYRPVPHKTKLIPVQVSHTHSDTSKIKEALAYCDSSGYNREFAVFVNLGYYSGSYRLFAINLLTKDTLVKGLVTHGHCKETEGRLAKFSNDIGCNCSSLGRYKIGTKYSGTFGTAYKLYGTDSSNSNAFSRFVVLHSHTCVPDAEQEDDICHSEGCPTVSASTLSKLASYIDLSSKPVLLWIYD